jgi:hypothetical protein
MIDQLNTDWQGRNADSSTIREVFKDLYANMNVDFRLAKVDPDGNCTKGINRVFQIKLSMQEIMSKA